MEEDTASRGDFSQDSVMDIKTLLQWRQSDGDDGVPPERFTCPRCWTCANISPGGGWWSPSQPKEVVVGVPNRAHDNTNKDIWQGQMPEFGEQRRSITVCVSGPLEWSLCWRSDAVRQSFHLLTMSQHLSLILSLSLSIYLSIYPSIHLSQQQLPWSWWYAGRPSTELVT